MYMESGMEIFFILFFIVFFMIFGIFIFAAIRGVVGWNKNNNSPRLIVTALIVAKRMNVDHHHHNNAGDVTGAHGYSTTTHTTYYVTFQVESGDRIELRVSGNEYGMLVEGDHGRLTFQGTRYLGFERMYMQNM